MATNAITGLTNDQEIARQRLAHERGQASFDVIKGLFDPTDPLNYLGPASRLGKAGLGMLGASLALNPGEAQASVIGPKAKTWHKTGGMFTDPFNKPLKEISDANAMLNIGNFDDLKKFLTGPQQTAEDVLHHPELWAAYPDIAKYPVKQTTLADTLAGVKGSFDPVNKVFRLGPRSTWETTSEGISKSLKDVTSTMLHEVSHAIQQVEGLSTGANKGMFETAGYKRANEVLKDAQDLYDDNLNEFFLKEGVKVKDMPKQRWFISDVADYLNGKSQSKTKVKEVEEALASRGQDFREFAEAKARIDKLMDKVIARERSDFKKYEKVGGEAMSRAVQKRYEEPWRVEAEPFTSSYDLPLNELTYKPSMWKK